MAEPLRIAIVGAESTGKTVLARALADELAQLTGLRCTWWANGCAPGARAKAAHRGPTSRRLSPATSSN